MLVIKKAISVFYQNVRDIKSKGLCDIQYKLHNDCDVISLSETWLNESILPSNLFDSRYHVVRA